MKRKVLYALIALTLLCSIVAVTVIVSGAESVQITGDMIDIENSLSSKRLGNIQRVADDGYIGIPYQIAVYRNGSTTVTSGIGGTPVIIYVINTNTERVGTDSDVDIINSMLDRGYLVVVLDYLDNAKATSPALEWSVLDLNAEINSGKFFSGMGIPTSDYRESFVVPAGYDISLSNVYWEIDKHSSAGTLEYIVQVWNSDFRSVFADTVIKWTDENGNRKPTQNGHDGSSPVWLNANGTASVNGEYIKAKHTLAESIEDCVKPDGSPLDLNLYMNVIYPTNPTTEVPVMSLAGSGDHLAYVPQSKSRPHFLGFLFNGYAGVVYDHGYVPMARGDHYKEFSGSSAAGVTGDNVTYSVSFYNDKKIHTAAMRYIRYLAASDSTFAFDTEAVGVYGNSKGGWMTFLGEEHPELLVEKRFFPGHHGESRYEAGEISSTALIDGGTEQPWLSYNGVTLDSGADLVYACCGGAEEHITDTHAPTFISCNSSDEYGTYYASSNYFVNACRSHDVPTMWTDVKVGHMFTYGPDTNFGFDSYNALFTFCGYYLKGDAVEVVYTSFTKDNTSFEVSGEIIVKFSGAVDASQIALVSITDNGGNAVAGNWSSQFGNTEWTFTPSAPLSSATEYTLTVPASVKGDNGLSMGSDFVQSFTTKEENSSEISFVQGTRGGYYYYDITAASEGADKYVLRFTVLNDANNLVEVYPVSSFNSSNPDSSVVAASPVAICGIDGAGVYECDVTSYVSTLTRGDTAAFLVKNARTAGETTTFSAPLDSWSGISGGNATYAVVSEIPGTEGTGAVKITGFKLTSTSGSEKLQYFSNCTHVITASYAIKNSVITAEDVGRTFTVSFRVYDTISRRIQANLTSATSSSNGVADYYASRYNFTTVAGEWVEFSFDYTVYEPEMFGAAGRLTKTLQIYAQTMGDVSGSYPIYFDSIETVEKVSTANLSESASLVFEEKAIDLLVTPYGRLDELYEDIEKYPIAIFTKNGDSWSFKTATATLPTTYNYGADTVIYFRTDFALSSQKHNIDTIGAGRTLTIDLGGNTLDITGGGQYYSFSSEAKVNNITFNMINGKVYSNGKASLVCIYSYGNNTVNLNYQNIDFTLGASFSEVSALVRHGYHPDAEYTATYNITFTDCDIDVSAANRNNLTVLRAGYDSSGGYVLNWTVNGGSLKTGTSEFYPTNLTTQKGGKLVLGKGSDGKYLKLIMTADLDNAMNTKTYSFDDGKTRYFGAVSTDGTNYVHEPLLLATEYGTIPNTKLSALKYPFVAFHNGAYKNAGDFFANNPNMEYGLRSSDGAVILMRRDYDIVSGNQFGNLSHHQGKIIFDLGGYTLNGEAGYQYGFFRATGMNTFTTELIVKNGTVRAANPVIAIATYNTAGNSYGEGKIQNFVFDNVNIISSSNRLINYSEPNIASTFNLTFNNCNFDFTSASTISNIFRAGYANNDLLDTTITVKGGSIKLKDFDESKFVVEYTGDSVIFDESAGKFELYISQGSASPTKIYATTGGNRVFMKQSSGEYDKYTLGTPTCKYGEIPVEYISASSYPILIYVKDGDGWTFHSAASSLPHSFTYGKDAVILLRDNVSLDSNVYELDTISSGTHLTIDLAGNTLNVTNGGQYWTFTTYFNTSFSFTIKDGRIENGGSANLISLRSTGSAAQSITLENVDISLIGSGSADGYLLTRYNDQNTSNTGSLNFTVKNCNIDTTANSTTTLRIFQAGRYDGMFNVTYTVIGGTVKTASYNDKMFYSESGSKVVFAPNENGEYTVIKVPTGSTLTQIIYYDTQNNNLYFVEQSSDSTYDTYMPESLVTPYGTIAWANSSRADYPFLAFKDNGNGTYTYITKNANFFADGGMEYSLRSYENVVVLMRSDFTTISKIGNLSNHTGRVIIDLGGYTLTVGNTEGAIVATAKHNTKTDVVIKNGTVLLCDTPFITFADAAAGAGKTFNFTLEDLTFKFQANATVKYPYRFANMTVQYDLSLTIDGCIFDLSENAPDGTTILPAKESTGLTNLEIEVIGSAIYANRLDGITISDNLSGITFKRDENNEYVTLTVPAGVSVDKTSYNTDLGDMTFVKLRTEGDSYVYFLRDTSKLISPKASLTLYSDFVYNVYVPAKDSVVRIILDGVLYSDLDALDVVEINGVEYYHITNKVSANRACESFVLTIEMQVFEGKTHTATWTLNVVSYLEKLLGGDYTGTVKTLAKDTLSYIRAIYEYDDLSKEAIDHINELIGTGYDATSRPDTDIEAVNDADGLSSACLELEAAPSFRFYLDGTYDAELYKFTVPGATTVCETLTDTDDRVYIRVSVYAYAMTETVSYTISGTDISGAFNLKAYYDFALSEGDEDLINLVERLWKYSESAEDYRNEVLNKGGN